MTEPTSMIDLLTLAPREAEAYAVAEGHTRTAKLFGRIVEAQERERTAMAHLRAIVSAGAAGDMPLLADSIVAALKFIDERDGVNHDQK